MTAINHESNWIWGQLLSLKNGMEWAQPCLGEFSEADNEFPGSLQVGPINFSLISDSNNGAEQGRHGCVGYFSCCYEKMTDKTNLGKKGFLLAYSLRVQSIKVKPRWQKCKVAGHIAPTGSRYKWGLAVQHQGLPPVAPPTLANPYYWKIQPPSKQLPSARDHIHEAI